MSDIGDLINKALNQAEIAVKKADEAFAASKEAAKILKELLPKNAKDKTDGKD